jgi:cysteine-rich repeat protein
MKINNFRLFSALTIAAAACGAPTDRELIETSVSAVAPAGSNAQLVSHNVPLTMNPGERLDVRITMLNNGATPGANDWNASYQLRRNPNTPTPFVFVSRSVVGTVPVGSSHDFFFVITAPTAPGVYTFGTRMFSLVAGQSGYFGDPVDVTMIVVDPANQRRWACQFEPLLSTLPAAMNPGQTQSVNVVVRNTGTGTWPATNFYLRSRDDTGPSGNVNLWGTPAYSILLTAPVAPGGTATFTMNITAPVVPGSYQYLRQILSAGQTTATNPGVGYFDALNHCVNRTISVGAAQLYDAAIVSQDFPTTMAPGETRTVTVIMQNRGTGTWTASDFRLYYNQLPRTFWGPSNSPVTAPVPPNGSFQFVFAITAPMAPGPYNHVWRMRKISNPNAGQFGDTINVPVTVQAQTPQFDAQVVSQTIPTALNQMQNATFEVRMRNSGTAAWVGPNIELFSVNTPQGLWTTAVAGALAPGETIPVNGERTFTFNVVSPAAAGLYDSRWQLRQVGAGGVGLFGEVAVTTNIDVNNCGNGVIDGATGETCDDSNRISGDGCSATCQIESLTVDLAAPPATGRTLIGSTASGQLANVAIGDVTFDGSNDVVVAEIANITPMVGPARVDAGRVAVYSGVGFFNGATTTVPTGATVEVWGADADDNFGGGGGAGVEVADVTGDGIPDIIASAPFADGAGNTRADCGQTYVIRGGGGISGVIDLRANPPPAELAATIVGRDAGDQSHVIAVGDLSGDGVADIVIGAPQSDLGGVDSGAVFVVLGGATLTGTISLEAAGAALYGTLIGAAAGDQVGTTAAIGDFGGTTANDLLLGSQVASPGGRFHAGAAWGMLNVAGTRNLATDFNMRWLGAEANDRAGASVAIGNVSGTARGDVLIGIIQANDALSVQVGAVDVWTGPIALGTYDMSTGATANHRIQGAQANDDAGRALNLGDVNGDGVLDIPVISSQADGPGDGRDRAGELAYFLGGPTLPAFVDLAVTAPPLLVYGPQALGRMGHLQESFATGNINGGNTDFCIGSYLAGGATRPGRVDCLPSPF